jgi:hypothetical protein
LLEKYSFAQYFSWEEIVIPGREMDEQTRQKTHQGKGAGLVSSVLFVHDLEGSLFTEAMVDNPWGIPVTICEITALRESSPLLSDGSPHLMVDSDLAVVKEAMGWAMQHGWSLGILP